MSRYTHLFAIVATVLVATGAAPVAAQESTPTSSTSGNASQTVIQIGDSPVVVRDYRYDGGEFVVTLDADVESRVAVSDVLGPVADQGATSADMRTLWIDGTTVIRIQVESYRGSAAVSIGTSSGAVYLSTGISSPNPLGGVPPTSAWFGSASVFIAMGIMAVRKVRNEGPDKPEAVS